MRAKTRRAFSAHPLDDHGERIAEFLPDLDNLIGEGLVTLEKVRIIAYRHNQGE